jgi:hypothetical protein
MGGITAQIEALAEALLDLQGEDDLAAWFAALDWIPYSLYRFQETKLLRPIHPRNHPDQQILTDSA